MTADAPVASVVMTIRREPAARLARTLAAVAAQEIRGSVEIIVAAPPEDEATVATLLAESGLRHARVVVNADGRRSTGLNLAIAAARAPVVCRVDARTALPPGYVATCVARLAADPAIGVVGGFQRPVPAAAGWGARGVARALANPYAVGAPPYRRRAGGGPVDTVYLGAWRRSELIALGGFDERLDANEDFELCRRFREAGFTVWLEEGLDVSYEARSAVADVWHQYFAFGRAKVAFWRLTGSGPNGRQAVALGLAAGGAGAGIALLRNPSRLAAAGVAGVVAVAVVDHIGVRERASAGERAAAGVGCIAIGAAWIAGVLAEAAVGDRP
jgi:GT2 family glycosyltransferase